MTPERLDAKPHDEAITFLQALDATGTHNLVAIHPVTQQVTGCTFAPNTWENVRAWIAAREGRDNLYFSVNEPKDTAPSEKLAKRDIARIRALWVDIDPRPDVPLDAERTRLQGVVTSALHSGCPPTVALDSGGGVQMFWILDQKVGLEGSQPRRWAEAEGKALARRFNADATHNIDRIMRVPGTLNLPTSAKRAKGRVTAPARVLTPFGARYSLEALTRYAMPDDDASAPEMTATQQKIAAIQAEIDVATARAGPSPDLQGRFYAAANKNPALRAALAGDLKGTDTSSSAHRAAVVAQLRAVGGFTAADYAALAFSLSHCCTRPARYVR